MHETKFEYAFKSDAKKCMWKIKNWNCFEKRERERNRKQNRKIIPFTIVTQNSNNSNNLAIVF